MNLKDEFDPIRSWATARGIYSSSDLKTQTIKLLEEFGELAKGIIKSNNAEIEDAIGDIAVVLTNVAHLHGTSIEECINKAYKVIENRTGSMKGGSFIKDE